METAKFCIQCGKSLPPEAQHCPNCGADVPGWQPTSPAEGGQVVPPPQPQPTPVTGPYAVPSVATGTYRPSAQPAIPLPHARSRKRLGGGGTTLIAGLILLGMHVFVLQGGMTPSNLGVDVAVIACGLVMLFARGGSSVALGFFASLCVSVFEVTRLLGTYQSVTAAGSQGFQTWLSSMAWVLVVAMVLVLVGFLAALVSLFRRS